MKFFVGTMRVVLALVIASIAFGAAGKPSAPGGLLVNGVSNPLAIDRDATRFTWMSADAVRGENQTAYQMLVASSLENLAAGKGDYWDCGEVDSDKSAAIECDGRRFGFAARQVKPPAL
jgi:alpha-L-rhamnosidase